MAHVEAGFNAAFGMSEPLLLALDTSTRMASVALARSDALLSEYTWRVGQNHTQQLLPVIKAIVSENNVTMADVTAIAVARGPGSFNGLRAGIATAKGFAFGLNIPLLAVNTLEIEAFAHAQAPWPIFAAHDAGRRELAWAAYSGQGPDGWHQLTEDRISAPETLARALKRRRSLLCGEVPAWFLPYLEGPGSERIVFATSISSVRRAGFLVELAWQRLAAGRTEDIATLQPLYLRRAPGERD